MINNYLDLIFQQRNKNPLYQKDYRLIYLSSRLNSLDELNKLKQWPNIKFTNVVYRPTSLYKDVKDNYYYELIDTGITSNTTFEEWKFFYIPLSKYNDLINIYPNILPTYQYYDIKQASNILIQTISYQILIPYSRPNIHYYKTSNEKNKHPLASLFRFTGYSFLGPTGDMLYEYIDTSTYCDDETVTYYSNMRPLYFHNDSYVISTYALQNENSLFSQKYNPPSKAELYLGIIEELQFTGKVTTKDFSSIKKWYEYNIIETSQQVGKILLTSAPTNLSLDFVKLQLNNTDIGFKFNLTFNTSYISINQTSSNNKIILT